jgi:tRNA pseudouridine55 synthase
MIFYICKKMKPDLHSYHWAEGALLLINKPLTFTSFQAINKVKYLLGKPKIGHSGTLDPLATGLLVVCTGKWTKKLTELTGLPKEYTGSITLGSTTPTYDLESEPENFCSTDHLTQEQIIENTKQFTGLIEQHPPIHSAIKVGGERAYHLARQGKEVIIKARNVTISEFEITKIELPKVYFRVACTSGTYIRTLAFDFGKALNVGGHLSSLCRTKVGEYCIEDAYSIEEFIEAFPK